MKKVTIPIENNQHLIATLFSPTPLKAKNAAVLFIPGWTSDETSYHKRAQALVDLGYICLTISLRGHGESSGAFEDFSREDHLQDAIVSYDFLALQKAVDTDNISIVGASYGAYIAALLATKRNIKHLALRVPALYYNKNFNIPTAKLVAGKEDKFFQNLHPEKENWALEGIRRVIGNVLIIQSEKDQIIPSNIMGLYATAAQTGNISVEHIIMKSSDHQLSKGEWKQEFITILKDFFKK